MYCRDVADILFDINTWNLLSRLPGIVLLYECTHNGFLRIKCRPFLELYENKLYFPGKSRPFDER